MPRERWAAGNDQVAHLHRGREARTACGLPPVSEQFAWPIRRRCIDCLVVLTTATLPTELILAGYGVRPRGRRPMS